jgi:hypothetical protein
MSYEPRAYRSDGDDTAASLPRKMIFTTALASVIRAFTPSIIKLSFHQRIRYASSLLDAMYFLSRLRYPLTLQPTSSLMILAISPDFTVPASSLPRLSP